MRQLTQITTVGSKLPFPPYSLSFLPFCASFVSYPFLSLFSLFLSPPSRGPNVKSSSDSGRPLLASPLRVRAEPGRQIVSGLFSGKSRACRDSSVEEFFVG